MSATKRKRSHQDLAHFTQNGLPPQHDDILSGANEAENASQQLKQRESKEREMAISNSPPYKPGLILSKIAYLNMETIAFVH
jgi:hypothetical protein